MAKKEKATTKICKYCQTEIPVKAKVCPQCRKKVKGGLLKWLVIGFVAVLGLSALGGNDDTSGDDPIKVGNVDQTASTDENKTEAVQGSENVSENEENTEKETEAPELTEFCVGDIVQDGDVKIVFMSSGEFIEENEYSQPKEGYKYIYLQFAFENTSEKNDSSVSVYSFECYADGYAAEMYYAGEEELSATLSAGRTTTGFVYFTVPENAKEIEVEYTPNLFIEKKVKFIYEGEKNSGYVPVIDTSATEGAYKVGDVVESSKLRITYLSCSEYVSDNMFVQPREGYRYITCEFEFENLGSSDEYISSFDFDCYADGVNCSGVYLKDDDLSATLSSGRKTKGTVTFEVPTNATVIEVEYLSNYWTSKRVVFTVQ